MFWMVWNPQRHSPTYRHPTMDSAIAEAERLARMTPGEVFIVLEAKCALRVKRPDPPPVERIPLHEVGDEIPF